MTTLQYQRQNETIRHLPLQPFTGQPSHLKVTILTRVFSRLLFLDTNVTITTTTYTTTPVIPIKGNYPNRECYFKAHTLK